MRVMRWLLLVLYLALVTGLGILATQPDNNTALLIVFAVAVVSLIAFIGGTASKDLWRPIGRPRLILPVISAGFMLAVLAFALTAALDELLRINAFPNAAWFGWALLAANWVFWSVLLFVYTRNLERFQMIYQLAKLVFAGSLAELLATVPSHIIVSRRGGCFVGIGTGIGILAGLLVMVWSFGPGILLLFLHHVRLAQTATTSTRIRSVAAHPWRVQFGIRALLLLTFVVGVLAGLGRTLWGRPFAVAFAASLLIYLLSMLLMRQSAMRTIAGLAVLVGTFYIFWEQPIAIGLFLLPGSVLFFVLHHFYTLQAPMDSDSNAP